MSRSASPEPCHLCLCLSVALTLLPVDRSLRGFQGTRAAWRVARMGGLRWVGLCALLRASPIASLLSAAPCPPEQALWNGTPTAAVLWDHSPRISGLTLAFIRSLPAGAVDPRTDTGPWGVYFRSVYGSGAHPIDARSLRWFWWWAPGAATVSRLQMFAWRRPRATDAWVPGDKREAAMAFGGFFIAPTADIENTEEASGLPDHSALEVLRIRTARGEVARHQITEAGSSGQVWFWAAPGSGVTLELGRTLALRTRAELLRWLAEAARHLDSLPPAERASHLAAMGRADLFRSPEPNALSAAVAQLELLTVGGPTGARYRRVCRNCTEPDHGPEISEFNAVRPRSKGSRHLQLCDLPRALGYDTLQVRASWPCRRGRWTLAVPVRCHGTLASH